MRAIFILCVTLAGCAASVPLQRAIPKEVSARLERPLTVDADRLEYDALYCTLNYWLWFRNKVGFRFDVAKPLEDKGITKGFVYISQELPVKYMVSWVVHFCGKHATVRRIKEKRNEFEDLSYEIFIFDADDRLSGHPYFECFQETSGSRHNAIAKALESPHGLTTEQDKLASVIVNLSQKHTLSFIIDPAVDSPRKTLGRLVHIPADDKNVRQALLSVLKQADLSFSVQGGVIYVFNKGQVMPSKMNGQRPRKPLAE